MNDLSKRIAGLSPEKRELLMRRLSRQELPGEKGRTIPRRGELDQYPLSYAQQRLWFLDQLEPGSPFYNVPAAAYLSGPLDLRALEKSINEIVRRHETLRATFKTVEGHPLQVIAPELAVSLSPVDLTSLPEGERRQRAQQLAAEEARRPFDLARGPLVRAGLLKLDRELHVMLMTMHHIISDGWSKGVLLAELAQLYSSYSSGRSHNLPEPFVQYADFAQWQRQWLDQELTRAQTAYWKDQLAGASELLELPTDRPRPKTQTYNGAREPIAFSKQLTESLKALGHTEQASLFMTLLAGFQALLYRYSGQDDISVGTPISGRNWKEVEGLIGFFNNTLVLRTDLSGDPSFRQLLGRARSVALGAFSNQDLPFERLVEQLHPQRSLSHNPLFQVMFVFENNPIRSYSLHEITLGPLDVDGGTSIFDLTLYMGEEPQGLTGALEYNTDLFDQATVRRMLGHFEALLKGACADPELAISDIELLSPLERQQITIDWNKTVAAYQTDSCIHHLFEEQARESPDQIAVICGDRQISFAELNLKANRLASHLIARGVGPEVRVAISVRRSIDMVIGLLGILKAGGAYVPIDPASPKERVGLLLEDSRAEILLTRQELTAQLPACDAEVICLDGQGGLLEQEGEENPCAQVMADNAAYVIYTSGSTGRPKGVVGLHRGAVNRFRWMWERYPFEKGEVCGQKTSLSFVDSVWEIFGPLLRGIPLVIVPDDAVRDARQFVKALATNRVTRLVLVPSLLRVMLDTHEDLGKELPRLRLWVTSGEALPVDLFERFNQKLKDRVLLNLYGSSEVSADVTCFDASAHKASTHKERLSRVPIGRPIANTRIYLLDRRMQVVPVGVVGELYAGGDGLARQYFDRPDLTAERFLPDPFGGEPGARLYRTGDLARYLPDGAIEYLGRIDHQVKIRGFRIEPGEVEAALARLPGVREAVVLAKGESPDDLRLVAYLVGGPEGVPSEKEVRALLKEMLPDHLMPSAFLVLDRLPLLHNGKIDRRALAKIATDGRADREMYAPPETATEIEVAGIWRDTLSLGQVGVNDNFFEVGGHSLLATQLLARVSRSFGVELTLRDLFAAPTIRALAESIEEAIVAAASGERVDELLEMLGRIDEREAASMLASQG